MSLKPRDYSQIPPSTARLVRRAPHLKRHRYIVLRDALGPLFADQDFAPLYTSERGRPAEAPAILAMVLILQFIEDLDDRGAAWAVETRVDWKYLLGLAWEDAGFDPSVLSEFRARLVENDLLQLFLTRVLELADAAGLLAKRGAQRTDATHVIGHVRQLNRLECVVRTLQAALNSLAVVAPRWLQSWVPEAWHARYDELWDHYDIPQDGAERQALADTVGIDGMELLTRCYALDAPSYLREVEAVEILRQVWLQQYYVEDTPRGKGLRWRQPEELPPQAQLICSPYEVEARYSTKRETHWLGYKVHVTETCDPDTPRLITHVATTPSTINDDAALPAIHQALADQERLPGEHFVDAGYVTARTLVESARDYGVRLTGPAPPDSTWQAQLEGGYTLAAFAIDWEAQVVTCPQGQLSTCWSETTQPGPKPPLIHIRFSRASCHACPERARCTRAKRDGRTLTFPARVYHDAMQTRRQAQQTPQFWDRLKPRGGIEGTLSQGVRAFGLRRTRYRGLAKTHLQHVLTATAMNLMRMVAWFAGQTPRGTRTTRFARLGAISPVAAV